MTTVEGLQDASAQEVVLGATKHLPFNQLEPGDLPFGLPVAPRQFQRRPNGGFVLAEPVGKRPHPASSRLGQLAAELIDVPLAHNGSKPQR